MNSAQIRLVCRTREDARECIRRMEGLLNGVVTPDGLTQKAEFHAPEPGRQSGYLVYGTLTVNLTTQERRS